MARRGLGSSQAAAGCGVHKKPHTPTHHPPTHQSAASTQKVPGMPRLMGSRGCFSGTVMMGDLFDQDALEGPSSVDGADKAFFGTEAAAPAPVPPSALATTHHHHHHHHQNNAGAHAADASPRRRAHCVASRAPAGQLCLTVCAAPRAGSNERGDARYAGRRRHRQGGTQARDGGGSLRQPAEPAGKAHCLSRSFRRLSLPFAVLSPSFAAFRGPFTVFRCLSPRFCCLSPSFAACRRRPECPRWTTSSQSPSRRPAS